MRCLFSIAVALSAAVSTGIPTASAQARDYPFCIKGANYVSSVGDCSFDTYQQCLDSASGRYAFCDRNPYFVQTSKPYVAKRKIRSRQQ
ncbi:DUF3551 domain-containing protein [Bradyrhizobium sp. AUGA SZCCT0182]|uniref:DUF3551 domain-containing protein n=1 Tax=Bradyrhizobium sp. AUGA SZCCT0182 TaxID=2807667 RepID=UPI001BAD3038|nr:DUF3551 domain-containing protein [Bradyrhizobium sp. AUGA SZCCT0182]MBR1232363.1 DUF3551 domain-containing protein [Bradyrhizobium sp. AUGA SZCCT0182]